MRKPKSKRVGTNFKLSKMLTALLAMVWWGIVCQYFHDFQKK